MHFTCDRGQAWQSLQMLNHMGGLDLNVDGDAVCNMNKDITHSTYYIKCASTYGHTNRASLRTSQGKAHPHGEDVRRFVQRCLNSSRLEAQLHLHRHLSATTLKRRMGYIRGILVTFLLVFHSASLSQAHAPSNARPFQLAFLVMRVVVQEQVAYATSWTTPPASLILRSASLEK